MVSGAFHLCFHGQLESYNTNNKVLKQMKFFRSQTIKMLPTAEQDPSLSSMSHVDYQMSTTGSST